MTTEAPAVRLLVEREELLLHCVSRREGETDRLKDGADRQTDGQVPVSGVQMGNSALKSHLETSQKTGVFQLTSKGLQEVRGAHTHLCLR